MWNNLDSSLAMKVLAILNMDTPGRPLTNGARVLLACGLVRPDLAMPAFSVGDDADVFADDVVRYMETCGAGLWEYDAMTESLTLLSNRTDCFVSEVKMPDGTLWFPAKKGLRNITFHELGYLFTLLDHAVDNLEMVDKALAVVFRPSRAETPEELASGWRGDRRRAFLKEESTVDARAEWWKDAVVELKNALYFWLISCRNAIVEDFPILFKKDFEEETPSLGGDEKSYGWAGVMLALSGGVVNLDAVAAQPWPTVFVHLAMLEDERRRDLLRRSTKGNA